MKLVTCNPHGLEEFCCDECGKQHDNMIEFVDTETGNEHWVCKDCLKKALEMLE